MDPGQETIAPLNDMNVVSHSVYCAPTLYISIDSSRPWMNFVLSMFEGDENWEANENCTRWSPIIHVGGEQQSRSYKDAERARYASKEVLVTEHPEIDGRRVWAARIQGGMDVLLGWLAADLGIHKTILLPFGCPKSQKKSDTDGVEKKADDTKISHC